MRPRTFPSGFLLAGLALTTGGCGTGGEVGAKGGEQMTLVLPGVAAEDGVVFSDFSFQTDGTLPQVGDLGAGQGNRIGREFLSFDLAQIPPGSVVMSAILRVDLYVVVGSPFATLGQVVLDHLDYGTLDGNDFGARALQEGLGPVATDPNLGARSVDVTAAVAQDVALSRARSQYRLRFSPAETDLDTENDFVSFAESEAAATGRGQAPVLIVVIRH